MSSTDSSFTSSSPRQATLSRTSTRSTSYSAISPIPEDAVLEYYPFPTSTNENSKTSTHRANAIHDVRAMLTNLLNCDTVRGDPQMRLLVQSRLMEAELEAKRQRRRRAGVPAIVLTPTEDERRTSL